MVQNDNATEPYQNLSIVGQYSARALLATWAGPGPGEALDVRRDATAPIKVCDSSLRVRHFGP